MKKLLLGLTLAFFAFGVANAQCVQTCSNYAVSSIGYSLQSVGGTSLGLQDDELSVPIPIGFNFNFMCSNYSQVLVSSNGFLTFDVNSTDNGCCSGQVIPNPGSSPNNFVAFTWNDLDPTTGGTITYTTVGVAPNQVFILTYSNIPHCCGNPLPDNSGQIKLFQTTNLIEIHTATISSDGSTTTQGIEDSTATIGIPTPGANGVVYSTTNTAYRWTNVIPTPPSAISGPTLVCSGNAYTFSVAPNPGASSYTWALPGGWSGTSTTNIISATTGTAAGTISVATTYTCGTSNNTTLAVNVTAGPTVAISGFTVVNCPGTAINLSASGADTYSWSTGAVTSTIAPTPTANTTYTVIGTSSVSGCSTSAIETVTVHPVLSLTTTGSGSICAGQSVTLTANGAATYTWNPTNINGTVVVNSPSVTTNYTVNATSVNGCTGNAVVSVVVSPCTGIKNISGISKNVSVHPNPNNGEFVIELKNGAKKNVEVYDLVGRVILSISSEDDYIDVNISNFANGIYYVKINSTDVLRVVKIIKE